MVFFEIRAITIIIATAIGAFTDYKTGLIYDKITYPLIGLAIILNLAEFFLFKGEIVSLFGIGIGVFAIGYLFYFTGKLGGGDVKLFTGIALMLPTINKEIFIVNVFLFSILVGATIISLYYLIQYTRKGIEWKENKKTTMKAGILGIVLLAYFYFLSQIGLKNITLIVLIIPILLALIFIALEKGIRKNFFLKWISLKEIEEDEIIAEDFLETKQKQKLNLGFKALIQPKDAKKLKEIGIKKLPVYRNLPKFGPFIFIGTILALIFPNAFALLFL